MMDVYIRRNSDGETRVYKYDGTWEEHSDYMWLDGGNYSCDCNRYRFFNIANNENPGEIGDQICGDTAYTILKFVLGDGTEIPGDNR